MATAAIAGYKGVIKTSTASGGASSAIAELREYTLTAAAGTFDATSHDSSGSRERIGGIDEWSGNAEYIYARTDAEQQAALDTLIAKTKVDFEFFPEQSTSERHFTGSGFFTSWEQGTPNEDIIAVNVEFEGTESLVPASSST
jgi:TP901-1 family phage major tail protein